MYAPQQPNNYRAFRVAQGREKRRRDSEEEAERLRQQNASTKQQDAIGLAWSELASASSPGWLGDALALDASSLVKERLERSAALGVKLAQETLQEEQEAKHKEHVQSGSDRKSKIGKLLGKLAEGTATQQTAHLVFAPSAMAAGGHVVTSSGALPQEKKRTINGKPSSTVVVTLCSGPEKQVEGDTDWVNASDALLGPWSCQAVQQECAKCGVVRSVRRIVLDDRVDFSDAPVRFFVRFDSVASAFKMAERWDDKRLAELCQLYLLDMPPGNPFADACRLRVSFYPTIAFDNSNFSLPIFAGAASGNDAPSLSGGAAGGVVPLHSPPLFGA